MENKDFVGYALGIVPGALTEEQTKECRKVLSLASKKHEDKTKKARKKRNNKQKGKRR